MNTNLRIIITMIAVGVVAWWANYAFADLLTGKKIEVTALVSPAATATPSEAPIQWTLSQKISEGKKLLENLKLTVGTKDIPYTEKRISLNNGKISITNKALKDPEKQIGLILLNIKTGGINQVVVTKRGGDLISPAGYDIEITERPSGIRWNYWATQYKITRPADTIVLLNKWPETKNVTIKKKVTQQIDYTIYSAYNDDLRRPDLIAKGGDYIKETVADAFTMLRDRKIYSKSFPNLLVANVPQLRPEFFQKIPLLEQSDLGEFLLDSQQITDRVKVVIATNEEEAFGKTCNTSSACGWIQFTPPTYNSIRKMYPAAKLITNFKTGAADHENSMMAAILLYDYNLAGLIKKHGLEIAEDSRLEEYLAASYNGSPSWVTKSLNAYISNGLNWIGHLRIETKGFIAKLRLIRERDLI